MTDVTIVDYGSGNIRSIARAFIYNNCKVTVTDVPEEVAKADRLVLPGVGAFRNCMIELERRNLIEAVLKFVATGKPFLGICVGMQVLLDQGTEFGMHKGLGLIPGQVIPIPRAMADGTPLRVPHIGWAELESPEITGTISHLGQSIIASDALNNEVYFVHSYTAALDNPEHCLAEIDFHGHRLTAAVMKENVTGVQFHPEKSGFVGLSMIERFTRL